jgi:hypothetical protein
MRLGVRKELWRKRKRERYKNHRRKMRISEQEKTSTY